MAATSALRVDASNEDQLRAWDGDDGAYWADHADYFDRSVAAYHQRLLDQAAISNDDRVLDVGCGTGQTTGTRLGPPRLAPRSESTCPRGCSTTRAAAQPRRASPTRRSSKPTRRSIPSSPPPSTWPSAAPRRCSSAITSQRSATSGARCVRADDCCS